MLHTVNKSPFEKNSLDTCLRMALPGAALLLIEDGVYAALKGTVVEPKVREAARQLQIFALGPDLSARGLSSEKLIDGVEVVGYDGFVELAVEHEKVQSWL